MAIAFSRLARGLLAIVCLGVVLLVAALCRRRSHRDASYLGEALFRQRCAVCHTTGDEGARGPGLGGVVGRRAAASRGSFAYSPALRASGLTWERPLLDRFLRDPSRLVPGTTMPMAVPDSEERRALIDYLASLHAGGSTAASARVPAGDYRSDGPGVRRYVTVGDLPPPYSTPSAHNGPNVVEPPPGARPMVPSGFTIDLFAKDLRAPRLLRVAPNGDLFVAETANGQVRVLRAKDGALMPERTEVFATGLDQPFGIAFFPPGPAPEWIYIANVNSVVRFAYTAGDLHARGSPQTIVSTLATTSGGHSTRDIAFSTGGTQMYVSVGSASNVGEQLAGRRTDEVSKWEAARGLGAAWDDESNRADVLAFDPYGRGGRAFATGIRNCVGLAVNPSTGEPWCSTNERDGLGDDLVPDYVTRVLEGAFYGWPWYYLGDHPDPRHANERADLAGRVTTPDVLLQAHSAPLQMAFYDGAMFPAPYRGNAFVCLHGSWNRASRTGPKVIRVLVDHGVPTGEYEDFVTGFTIDDASVWARPVGVAVARDGALLISDDGNGTLWRIAYRGPPPSGDPQ